MKKILIFLCTTCSFLSLGQNRIKGYIGLSQNIDHLFRITASNLDFGATLEFDNSSLFLFGTYTYGGVINYTKHQDFGQEFKPYQLDFHLLGGGVKFRFIKNKFYSPSIKLTFTTQIASKYRGDMLITTSELNTQEYVNLSPTNKVKAYSQSSYENPGEYELLYYESYNYISSPLVGSFFFENEFRITKSLRISIELGYLIRAIRYYHNTWLPNESEPSIKIIETHKLKDTPNGKTVFRHYFELGVGVSYTFSFHKNSKTTPKTP